MNFKEDTKRYEKIVDEYDKVKIRCKCGHRVIVPLKEKKRLCGWCGYWVYRDKKEEFKDKLKGKIKENKYEKGRYCFK